MCFECCATSPTPCERKTSLRIEWSHKGMDGMNKSLTHLEQERKEFHMSYMEFPTKMDLWPSKTISLLHNFLGLNTIISVGK